MKGDPEDIKNLAEDLHGALHRHNDACKNNPDLQTELVKLRDKAYRRYEEVSEGRKSQHRKHPLEP